MKFCSNDKALRTAINFHQIFKRIFNQRYSDVLNQKHFDRLRQRYVSNMLNVCILNKINFKIFAATETEIYTANVQKCKESSRLCECFWWKYSAILDKPLD